MAEAITPKEAIENFNTNRDERLKIILSEINSVIRQKFDGVCALVIIKDVLNKIHTVYPKLYSEILPSDIELIPSLYINAGWRINTYKDPEDTLIRFVVYVNPDAFNK